LLPALLFAADRAAFARAKTGRNTPSPCSTNRCPLRAELVPAEKVRKQFGSDVDSRYLVVEVGMFPKARDPLEVRPATSFCA